MRLYKGASFLIGKLGTKIGSELLKVIDDGTIPGALGSRPSTPKDCRREKKSSSNRANCKVICSILTAAKSSAWLLPATRLVPSVKPPGVSPANFYLASGKDSPEKIIKSVKAGLYVTEMIGFGVNMVTGDYSRGAAGLWIENGEFAFPVEEITIAGNLKEMLQNIEMVGDDLEMRGRIASPTVKISR